MPRTQPKSTRFSAAKLAFELGNYGPNSGITPKMINPTADIQPDIPSLQAMRPNLVTSGGSSPQGFKPAPLENSGLSFSPGALASNTLDSVKNFFQAMPSFAVPAIPGLLSQVSPHESIRSGSGKDWFDHSMAGAKDMAESVKQLLWLNNAWDSKGNYIGPQPPQNVAQHRQQISAKYLSAPRDADLKSWYDGAARASDQAARTIPDIATGRLALNAASKVPALANAGTAIKQTIENSRYLDPAARATSVATGLPLHPAAVGGNLAAPMYIAQQLQYTVPGLSLTPEIMPYLPAPAADSLLREVHPNAPLIVDALANPNVPAGVVGTVFSPPVLQAANDLQTPFREQAEQKQQQAQEQAQQQELSARQDHAGLASAISRIKQDPADPVAAAMVQDPAIHNRVEHGALPEDAVAQLNQHFEGGQQPADPVAAAVAGLPDDMKPVAQQTAKDLADRAAQDPTIADAVQNPTGDAGKKIATEAQPQYIQTAAADYSAKNPPPTNNPQDWGTWLQDMMTHIHTSWDAMDPVSKVAFGIGVPLGLIGLLSGNMGGFLLGALGLGAAGVAGASSGMFGSDTQNQANGVLSAAGIGGSNPNSQSAALNSSSIGNNSPAQPKLNPEEITPELQLNSLNALAAKEADVAKLMSGNRQIYDHIANLPQAEMLGLFQQLQPDAQQGLIDKLKTAQRTLQQAAAMLSDPTGLGRFGVTIKLKGTGMTIDEIPERKKQVDSILTTLLSKQSAARDYVQHTLIPKIARCWKGYEPVPGSKPYTNGSCRPKGSKKTQKEMKKKSDAAVLTIIRGYYGKQANSQGAQISTKGGA